MFYVKLRYLRERANMTREQLSKSLNITYSALSKYETNQRQPDLNTLRNIASFFNVSIDYLLDSPYNNEAMKNDIALHFDLLKSIVKDNETVYFNDKVLSDTSKSFIYDSIEYISNQITNINDDDK